MAMSDGARFGLGALAVVLALVGLFVAARAVHGLWYHVGLGVFGVCVLAVFVLIRLSTGKTPGAPAGLRKGPAEDRSVRSTREDMPEPRPEPQPEPEAR